MHVIWQRALPPHHFLLFSSSGDSKWIYVYVVAQKNPLLYPPCRACHTCWCMPLRPAPWPSFMMETDTNTVIGFQDKLFTLPMLSAAVTVPRGHPFYKWTLFLDLLLLIDLRKRQYMCDWGHGHLHGKSSAQSVTPLSSWCELTGCRLPVWRGN